MRARSETATIGDDLRGSDILHWGKDSLGISQTHITNKGVLAPGPDYRLYLVPKFVQEEAEFIVAKSTSVEIARVRHFRGFSAAIPTGVDASQFNTVVVWCETFGEVITAAKFK